MHEYLRTVVTVALTAMSMTVAPFFAMLGLIGFAGRLSDTSRSENTQAGILLLGTAALIWIASLAWYVGCYVPPNRRRFSWRFSVRTLLIVTTLVAVAMGAIVAAR